MTIYQWYNSTHSYTVTTVSLHHLGLETEPTEGVEPNQPSGYRPDALPIELRGQGWRRGLLSP